MAKPVSEKRARTRERLIAAAADAIRDKGFRETTLDEIASRASLTKGAIYDNFKSKDELFFAVMACNPGRLPAPANPGEPPTAKLREMARQVTAGDDAQSLQIPLRAEFLLYTLRHPEMRETMHAWLREGFAAEERVLTGAFSPGELRLSPKAMVVMLQAMVPGLLYLRTQAPDLIKDDLVEEIFAALA